MRQVQLSRKPYLLTGYQVAVPEKVAVKLSYPERVTKYNMAVMREAVINGSRLHPGANVLEKKTEVGQLLRVALHAVKAKENRKRWARELQVGDIIHRHLRDGE